MLGEGPLAQLTCLLLDSHFLHLARAWVYSPPVNCKPLVIHPTETQRSLCSSLQRGAWLPALLCSLFPFPSHRHPTEHGTSLWANADGELRIWVCRRPRLTLGGPPQVPSICFMKQGLSLT